MAYQLVLTAPSPATVPLEGWSVGYRVLGTSGAYITSGPYMSFPITIPTSDAVGTLYEGYITRDCGSLVSPQFFWQTPCNCTGAGYSPSPAGDQCQDQETIAPTVTGSGYCLTTSQDTAYGIYGSRIYQPGFTTSTLNIPFGTPDALIVGEMTTATQWRNNPATLTTGPLNREGVWVSQNCDGIVDQSALTATIAFQYINPNTTYQYFYLGIAGDNSFIISQNGTIIADSGIISDLQFRIWHIIPIGMIPGVNYINLVSTNITLAQSVGMVLYNNTISELSSATSDASLDLIWQSSGLRGTSFDVSTCPDGYSLNVEGGVGNYICVRTIYKDCNTLV